MRFHSAISENIDTLTAADHVCADIRRSMKHPIDLLFAFFTADHLDSAQDLLDRLHDKLSPDHLIGVSAEGVIGADQEIERSPGLSLLAAHLPNVRAHPFHISTDDWQDLLTDDDVFKDRFAVGPETRALIAFGDPFTTATRQFLPKLDDLLPGIPLIGGMASAARNQGENRLFFDDQLLDNGLVGVALHGAIQVETVVSQGCRPIGRTFLITKAKENLIEQLGGRPSMLALKETIDSIPESDRQLLRNGLFLGRAISEYRDSWGRGDFLVRNVIGVDQKSGAIAVTEYVRPGQTVQFHVRDEATADEDLFLLLHQESQKPSAAGALLFSCNGRGSRLFSEPCHDITAAREAMPQTPVAGFFAAGELGPIGQKNFIHGHTASFALFRPIM